MIAKPSQSALHLLVVDDDQSTRVLMSALFAGCDVVVDSVGDGAEALTLLRSGSYDALILDLMLPRRNGFEILRDLKNTQPEILKRTIVLTAVSEATLRDFDDGRLVRKVMRKPFEIGELTHEVLACREMRIGGEEMAN